MCQMSRNLLRHDERLALWSGHRIQMLSIFHCPFQLCGCAHRCRRSCCSKTTILRSQPPLQSFISSWGQDKLLLPENGCVNTTTKVQTADFFPRLLLLACTLFTGSHCWYVTQQSQIRCLLQIRLSQPSSHWTTSRIWQQEHNTFLGRSNTKCRVAHGVSLWINMSFFLCYTKLDWWFPPCLETW